ncbi:hypothetical protein Psi02_32900 [Planotetraspora silvatica]|uniref:Uncharacterized protein n=1 Tax=Planotetraspora silvatica TaxID=234614 RepID=A0A8J3XNZ9_9ACTN|nr:hypothetical protein [Planotetraspora silvatica]GII46866.1 hypothetical protein Psi02_32900 [Planotetraspora silvatica]
MISSRNGWDPLAAIAVLIAVAMLVLYVVLIRQQGGHAAAWFLGGLAVAALLGIYGVAHAAPRRGLALAVSGVVLMLLGILGILSIGLPILGAGVLAVVAAARSR